MKPVRSMRKVRGLTLIEILISLTIGLVVVGAVVVSFVGSGQASRYHSALTQMNQDAQIALNMLSREVQLAGYSAPASLTGSPRVVRYHSLSSTAGFVPETTGYIFGCDGGTNGVDPFATPTATTLTCTTTMGTASSGLALAYEADLQNTVPTAAGIPSDCLGSRIGPQQDVDNVPYYVARNRYFISVEATSGRRELYCASPTSQRLPLVPRLPLIPIPKLRPAISHWLRTCKTCRFGTACVPFPWLRMIAKLFATGELVRLMRWPQAHGMPLSACAFAC